MVRAFAAACTMAAVADAAAFAAALVAAVPEQDLQALKAALLTVSNRLHGRPHACRGTIRKRPMQQL
jgi:hypothetical protein